jgi:hypothetical protein
LNTFEHWIMLKIELKVGVSSLLSRFSDQTA